MLAFVRVPYGNSDSIVVLTICQQPVTVITLLRYLNPGEGGLEILFAVINHRQKTSVVKQIFLIN
jgi:hypothetical protein